MTKEKEMELPREVEFGRRACATEGDGNGIKSTMKVLYLGRKTGTSGHRANALRRLGHEVEILDIFECVPKLPLIGAWHRYLGFVGLASLIRARMLDRLAGRRDFDLVWVDSGGLVSRELVEDLKRLGKRVLNYNVDDPYGNRDVNAWLAVSPRGVRLRPGGRGAQRERRGSPRVGSPQGAPGLSARRMKWRTRPFN